MARMQAERVERVAVLGAGTIGASWATLFLSRGLRVAVYDPAPDTELRIRAFIADAWPTLEQRGLAADADPTLFTVHDDPAEAVRGAALVQESGPENLEIKRELFQSLDTALDADAVVASSTSGLMPSELQAGRTAPDRYLVAHPFNPPHLIPLVEVVGGRDTDPAVIDWAIRFYTWLGKHTIRVRREVPGHVANRMQAALYREAIHLVLEGVASVEDVDAAVSSGPGLRWAIMGPHLQHHLAGGAGGLRHLLEHIGPGIQRWWSDLGRPLLTPEVIDRLVSAFEAGRPRPMPELVEERDALLIALLQTIESIRQTQKGSGEARG
jgi:carnitine 3-dehydrogenase